MKHEERVFTILNKLNRIYMASKSKIQFLELIKMIASGNKMIEPKLDLDDLEFSKAMDEYIELNKIK